MKEGSRSRVARIAVRLLLTAVLVVGTTGIPYFSSWVSAFAADGERGAEQVYTLSAEDDADDADEDGGGFSLMATGGAQDNLPDTIETVNPPKTTINLFDYSGVDYNDNTLANAHSYVRGINAYGNGQLRPLLFLGTGNADRTTMNNWTGSAAPFTNIVNTTLDANGYPTLNRTTVNDLVNKTGAGTSVANNYNTSDLSLAYLFNDASVNGKTRYGDVTNLFRLDDNGYYIYDSDTNYAYYDPSQGDGGSFDVYDTQYNIKNSEYPIGFFPFTPYNEGYGNVRLNEDDDTGAHFNHHFGMSISSEFNLPHEDTYGQKTYQGNDMVFDFSGDDDVWVFIDDVLVLDMGGIHDTTRGSINFTRDQVIVNNEVVGSITDAFAAAGKTYDNSELSHHTLKFFYLERGANVSNCKITMNLFQPETTSLSVEKKWLDEEGVEEPASAHVSDSMWVQLYQQSDDDHDGTFDAAKPYGEPIELKNGDWSHVYDNLPVNDDWENSIHYFLREGRMESGEFVASETYESQTAGNEDVYRLVDITYNYTNGTRDGDVEVYPTYRYSTDPATLHQIVPEGTESSRDACFTNGTTSPSLGHAVIRNQKRAQSITVSKVWLDENGQEEPASAHTSDSVWVRVLDNGTQMGDPVRLDDADAWKAEFDGIVAGDGHRYTVEEGTYDPATRTWQTKTTLSTSNGDEYALDSIDYSRTVYRETVVTPEKTETKNVPHNDYKQVSLWWQAEKINNADWIYNYTTDTTEGFTARRADHSANASSSTYATTDTVDLYVTLPTIETSTPLVINGVFQDRLLCDTSKTITAKIGGAAVQATGTMLPNGAFRVTLPAAVVNAHKGQQLVFNVPVMREDKAMNYKSLHVGAPASNPITVNVTTQYTTTETVVTPAVIQTAWADDESWDNDYVSVVDKGTGAAVISNRKQQGGLEVEKVWLDGAGAVNTDTHLDDSVWVRLYRNGQPVAGVDPIELKPVYDPSTGHYVPTDARHWKGSFNGLASSDASDVYTVVEGSYDGTTFTPYGDSFSAANGGAHHQVSIVYYDDEGTEVGTDGLPGGAGELGRAVITNAPTSRLIVRKEWSDGDTVDHSGDSVTVQLKKNGADYRAPVTLSDENDWTFAYEDVEAGDAITYTIEETSVRAASGRYRVQSVDYARTELVDPAPTTTVYLSRDVDSATRTTTTTTYSEVMVDDVAVSPTLATERHTLGFKPTWDSGYSGDTFRIWDGEGFKVASANVGNWGTSYPTDTARHTIAVPSPWPAGEEFVIVERITAAPEDTNNSVRLANEPVVKIDGATATAGIDYTIVLDNDQLGYTIRLLPDSSKWHAGSQVTLDVTVANKYGGSLFYVASVQNNANNTIKYDLSYSQTVGSSTLGWEQNTHSGPATETYTGSLDSDVIEATMVMSENIPSSKSLVVRGELSGSQAKLSQHDDVELWMDGSKLSTSHYAIERVGEGFEVTFPADFAQANKGKQVTFKVPVSAKTSEGLAQTTAADPIALELTYRTYLGNTAKWSDPYAARTEVYYHKQTDTVWDVEQQIERQAWTDLVDQGSEGVQVVPGGMAEAVVTNEPAPAETTVVVQKVDAAHDGKGDHVVTLGHTVDEHGAALSQDWHELLAGAEFTLYADDDDPTLDTDADEQVGQPQTTSSTDADYGTLSFEKLSPGVYWVVETGAPIGYQLATPVAVRVDADEIVLLDVTASTQGGETVYSWSDVTDPDELAQRTKAVGDDQTVTMTVADKKVDVLPMAGSSNGLFMQVGAYVLFAFAGCMAAGYVRSQRRKTQ